MKPLTKLWSSFTELPLDFNNIHITKRLYLNRLEAPNGEDDLYLAINNLSGAMDILSKEEGEILHSLINSQFNVDEVPKYFLISLKNRGYIFPNPHLEELSYQMMVNHYKNNNAMHDKITAYFSIDTTCAVGCDYCFQSKRSEGSSIFERSRMDKESLISAFNALDMLRALHKKDVDFVGGFGGEPLQERHVEVNELFMACAKERQYPVIYFSSLALLGDKTRNLLIRNANQIRVIATTIDGLELAHNTLRTLPDSFKRTVENIDSFLEAGIKVMVRTNLGPATVGNIPHVADFYAEKKWFDYPNFRGIVSRIIDRYHKDKNLYTENQAMSVWLELQDKYSNVKKLHDYKIAYSLHNIVKATQIREDVGNLGGGDEDNFTIFIPPIISYCSTDTGINYTFTGGPSNSIYACPVGSCFTKHKLGSHSPYLTIDEEKAAKWGKNSYIGSTKGIDSYEICRNCEGATLCGSNCSLEAVSEYGSNDEIYCKDINTLVKTFLTSESSRFYRRCKALL